MALQISQISEKGLWNHLAWPARPHGFDATMLIGLLSTCLCCCTLLLASFIWFSRLFTYLAYLDATALKWVMAPSQPKTSLSKYDTAAQSPSASSLLIFQIWSYKMHTVAHYRLDCLAFALCSFFIAGLGLACQRIVGSHTKPFCYGIMFHPQRCGQNDTIFSSNYINKLRLCFL